MKPGDYKVYGDDKVGAVRITGEGDMLCVQGNNGRYHADPAKVERFSPCQLHDDASFRQVNDSTLAETFDSYTENRPARWQKQ